MWRVDFTKQPRAEVAICVATNAGSLSTDLHFWQTRGEPGGASPSLFVYTLPSSIIGEISIRHGLTGPNLCLMGGSGDLLAEAGDWLHRGEAAACVCVSCEVVTSPAAALVQLPAASTACAAYLQRGVAGHHLAENDRDLISLCAKLRR